jgi:hypothetical protein
MLLRVGVVVGVELVQRLVLGIEIMYRREEEGMYRYVYMI